MPETNTKGTWTKVAFGDVVRLSRERANDPLADGFERYVGLEHIEPNDLKIRSWGDIADGTTFTSVFRTGQVLFGKRRAYQRKVAVADFSGVCSGDIYILEPANEKLLPELLPFLCQTDAFFEHAVGTSAGSLSPRTNWKSLSEYEFALPPLEEQRRIVGAMIAADDCLGASRRLLDELKQVEESTLAQEFAGQRSTRMVPARRLLDDGLLKLQTGPFGTVLSASEYLTSGWPVINPSNIKNGTITSEGAPCVGEETAMRLASYRMEEGDILLARKGEIDKACLVQGGQNGWVVGSDCILLRLDNTSMLSGYLLTFLRAPETRRFLTSFAHGTVMPGLNEKMLSRLMIPVRPLREQKEVVDRHSGFEQSRKAIGAYASRCFSLRTQVLATALRPFSSEGIISVQ